MRWSWSVAAGEAFNVPVEDANATAPVAADKMARTVITSTARLAIRLLNEVSWCPFSGAGERLRWAAATADVLPGWQGREVAEPGDAVNPNHSLNRCSFSAIRARI
jgi:hypothetical protein